MYDQMKRWILLAIIPMMLCLAWASVQPIIPAENFTKSLPVDQTNLVSVPETTNDRPEEGETPVPAFEIGIWQGSVAVFLPGSAEPIQTLETPVVSLPQPDQALLQDRIPVYDQLQLASYLEDYGS